MKKKLQFLLFPLLFWGCTDNIRFGTGTMEAYVPVYAQAVNLDNISVETPKAIEKPGKVYVIGNLLLQNDINKGVHLIDISNRNQPRKISFLRVPFSTEISVKNQYLYVNNFNDLLVFDLNNPQNPTLVKRLNNVFPYHNSEYPPATNVFFECVDHSKGIVVDWKLELVKDPKCRR